MIRILNIPSFLFLVSEGKNICHYNEDCPPNKYCDRLNRQCINPCLELSCGENAKCYTDNHKAQCKCLSGYDGRPDIGCKKISTNPCIPNPCGLDAMCENDNGNPICFCPKGLTGNPFEECSMYSIWHLFITESFIYNTILGPPCVLKTMLY